MKTLGPTAALIAILGGCGVGASSYAVDLTTTERCDIREGIESCVQPIDELRSTNLMVDPRQDRIMIWLDDTLYWSPQDWPTLTATRIREHHDLDHDCLRRDDDQLELTFGFSSVEGRLVLLSGTQGDDPACGQTPLGQKVTQDLRGVAVVGP